MQKDQDNSPAAGRTSDESLLDKAKPAPADAAKGIVDAIKGPADGSKSASNAGSPGYVDNREDDEAVVDTDKTAGPCGSEV